MTRVAPEYTVITPSRGDRPKALRNALESVLAAANYASMDLSRLEILVGFDGCKGERVLAHERVTYVDFPFDGNYGNAIRNAFVSCAKGRRLLFVDDDNALTPSAFSVYERLADVDMVVARIDTSRTLDVPYIPVEEKGRELMRPTNVDPLCVCLSRELVAVRGKGWGSAGGYLSDYQNLHRYWRRAASVHICQEVVGVYDAGLGLDEGALSPVQQMRLVSKTKREQG